MESLKSPKFIFAVLGLVAVLVLTVTGKITGETAVTVILSFGVGLGLAANTTAGKSTSALLPLLLLLAMSGCATSSLQETRCSQRAGWLLPPFLHGAPHVRSWTERKRRNAWLCWQP